MKRHLAASVGVLIMGLTMSAESAVIVVDPDDFASGTDISNAFPGVTLTTFDGEFPGSNGQVVYALADSTASTGSNVFSYDTVSGNETWGNGSFKYLQADFTTGATSVSLDFIVNDSGGDNQGQRALWAK